MQLTLGHSPDPDDAFMVCALHRGMVPTRLDIELVSAPIDTLNERIHRRALDASAVSAHAYAHLHEHYRLLPVGTSVGRDYGPVVVAAEALSPEDLVGAPVAVPGPWTTAHLVARLALGDVDAVRVPFDRIPEAVREGRVAAGVVIHEGQLTYGDQGLHRVLDLGTWWSEQTGLPLPLGVTVVARRLPDSIQSALARLLSDAVRWSMEHREAALDYAMTFGRGLDRERVDRFVAMYVNDDSVDLRDDVVKALEALYDGARQAGFIEDRVPVDPVPLNGAGRR